MKKIGMLALVFLTPLIILFGCQCKDKTVQISGPHKIRLAILNDGIAEEIKKDPSRITQLFQESLQELTSELPPDLHALSEAELFAIYCSLISYIMAPYGNSTEIELRNLLEEDHLDCDNYAILTKHLFDIGLKTGEIENADSIKFIFVGWNGGAVGNHAQIFVQSAEKSMVLDPTIALLAFADFDSIASGRPVPSSRIIDFSTRCELDDYRQRVINAICKGLYRPSDLLYYFVDFQEYLHPKSGSAYWYTPGAASLNKK